jgi:hypothetical protein
MSNEQINETPHDWKMGGCEMSDTPETDDQPIIYAMNDNGYQVPCVDLEFACRLKRERDEAREKLINEMKWHHRTHTELVQTQCKILDMQMGRDEIQDKYDTLAVENMLEVNKLCKERDEAREQVDRYRDKLDLLPISWEL